MSLEGNNAIIEFDIILSARSRQEINEGAQKIKSDKDLAGDLLEDEKKDKEEKKTELTELLEKLTDNDVKKLQRLLLNPSSALEFGLENFFARMGPNAGVVLTIAGLVAATPALTIELMKALSVKGGPFNRDFRRFMEDEGADVVLTRMQQKQKELGEIQTILTDIRGFIPNNENWQYNSYYSVDKYRIARIGLDDRAAGIVTV